MNIAVRKSLTTESVKTLVQALTASRLNYCNSVFHWISTANLQALQSVLNAGARLIIRKLKYEHITATLRDDLHWFIHQWIMYKLCTIVYKCLHGAAPCYLTEMCVPVTASTDHRCLLSAARGDLMVPRTRTITYGSQSFAVSRPRVWNDFHHTRTVPKQTKDNTILLGLRDMTWRFYDCLSH